MQNSVAMPKLTPDSGPLTQDNGGHSITEYNYIITFDWRPSNEKPFEIFKRTCFSGREVPTIWYTKVLSPKCRLKKLQLTGLPGKEYSVFCKIAVGKGKLY